eukprot:scaffold96651_cov65-Phaeocystis_antarctica.AAC.4
MEKPPVVHTSSSLAWGCPLTWQALLPLPLRGITFLEREPHADDPYERERRERAQVEEDTQCHVKRDLNGARGSVADEADEKHPPHQALTPFPEAIQKQACKQRELGQGSRDEKRTSSDHELVRVEQDGDH